MNLDIETDYAWQMIRFACNACDLPNLADKIHLGWSNGFTRALGKAGKHKGQYRIRFAHRSWPSLTTEVKKNIIIHEACHIIVLEIHGSHEGHPHGKKWQWYMHKCGENPMRIIPRCLTPNLKVQRKKMVKFNAYCPCGIVHKISARRRNLVLAGKRYHCIACKGDIKLAQTPDMTFDIPAHKIRNYN